ncbi:MAG: carboxymuconolactone decarboxylase family protein [Betaproteobacteria bacterium]
MPTVPYLTDENLTAGRAPADLVAAIRARRGGGKLLNLDRMLLHSAPIARGWNTYMGSIRRDLKVSPILRELAICAIAKLNNAPYEWVQHAPEFLASGGKQSQLDTLADIETAHVNSTAFDRAERATLALAREMSRSIDVSKSTRDEICALLPDEQVVEIVAVIASYNMVSRFLVALGISADGEDA